MTKETLSIPQKSQQAPDNILTMDISTVKNLQIGYHAETMYLYQSADDSFVLKEYIGGLSGSEYYAKVTANRIKTTIRYGRREEVNRAAYIEIFLPESWHGELQLSSQYGNILTEENWVFDRFAAESMEGSISLKSITAPRIRMSCPVGNIQFEKAEGFADLHSVSGNIVADAIIGGAKLETSGGSVSAAFPSLNNIVECSSLNGQITLIFSKGAGIQMDGASKTGSIVSEMEHLAVQTKPGNKQYISGMTGQKPFQKVRISSINGNILLQEKDF